MPSTRTVPPNEHGHRLVRPRGHAPTSGVDRVLVSAQHTLLTLTAEPFSFAVAIVDELRVLVGEAEQHGDSKTLHACAEAVAAMFNALAIGREVRSVHVTTPFAGIGEST